MRKILVYYILPFLVLAFSACQNNGNIGNLFGTWRIDSYSVDGIPVSELHVGNDTLPLSSVTFSFQNNIVNAVTVADTYMVFYSQFGTWSEEGTEFTLDFTHTDANTEAGTGQYAAPKWLGMISDEKMVMKKTENKKDSFTLTWIDPKGSVRVYVLHKTW